MTWIFLIFFIPRTLLQTRQCSVTVRSFDIYDGTKFLGLYKLIPRHEVHDESLSIFGPNHGREAMGFSPHNTVWQYYNITSLMKRGKLAITVLYETHIMLAHTNISLSFALHTTSTQKG